MIIIYYQVNLTTGPIESINDTMYYTEGISFLVGQGEYIIWPEGTKPF